MSAYTEEVEKALPVEQREVLWQLFRHLVGVEDGGYRVAKHRSRPANIGDDATLYDSSFSLDGTRVVSAGADGTVRLWHADGAGEPVILRGHELWVRDATFSPDGTRVVSAGFDGKVRLWHADGTGEPLVLSSHEGGVNVASFSPDGTRAVSAGSDGAVRLWRIFASEHALIDAARASRANSPTSSALDTTSRRAAPKRRASARQAARFASDDRASALDCPSCWRA